MKVQCPQCREIVEMVEFSTSAEGLGFTCGNCKKENFLPNPGAEGAKPEPAPVAAERSEAVPVGVPAGEVTCPKCGHSQKDPYACHRCGLVFGKFDESSLPPDPEEASGLWKEVLLVPADEERHEAFIDACQQANRLDYAARQYRLMLRKPQHNHLAEKMLEKLFSKAQAQLAPVTLASEGRRDDRKKTGRILFWILLAVCGGLLIYYIITLTDMLSRVSR